MTSCFVYTDVRDLESIDQLCIKRLRHCHSWLCDGPMVTEFQSALNKVTWSMLIGLSNIQPDKKAMPTCYVCILSYVVYATRQFCKIAGVSGVKYHVYKAAP